MKEPLPKLKRDTTAPKTFKVGYGQGAAKEEAEKRVTEEVGEFDGTQTGANGDDESLR